MSMNYTRHRLAKTAIVVVLSGLCFGGDDGDPKVRKKDPIEANTELKLPNTSRCMAALEEAYLVGAGKDILLIDDKLSKSRAVITAKGNITCIAASGDAKLIAYAVASDEGDSIQIVDSTYRLRHTIALGKDHQVQNIALDWPGKTLGISFRIDGKNSEFVARYFDVESGKESFFPSHCSKDVVAICFSHDGKRLILSSADGGIRVLNRSDLKVQNESSHAERIQDIVASKDNKFFICWGLFQEVFVFEQETGRLLWRLEGHEKAVRSVSISSKYGLVVASSFDRSIRVWDLGSGKEAYHLTPGFATGPALVMISERQRSIVGFGVNDEQSKSWRLKIK